MINDVDTILSLTDLVCNPLPTSLFCGLILDVLPTDAVCTDVLATCVFTSPNELIAVKDEVAPTQLITKELCKLENFLLHFLLPRIY